jgi:BTB And C-terminal Kelch
MAKNVVGGKLFKGLRIIGVLSASGCMASRAPRYAVPSLRSAALSFTKENFFLMHRTALRTLDRETILQLLSHDELVVFSEMQVRVSK